MQQQTTQKMAKGGRSASRQRRQQLAGGKVALPPKAERTRKSVRATDTAQNSVPALHAPAAVAVAPAPTLSPSTLAPNSAPNSIPKGGRAASRARRQALVKGKTGIAQSPGTTGRTAPRTKAAASPAAPVAAPTCAPAMTTTCLSNGRRVAQAARAKRAMQGADTKTAARPTGRVRNTEALKYPAKVEVTKTYGAQCVTGIRVDQGQNVTGNEPGTDKPISGTQYIAADGIGAYRGQSLKVGASKTENGGVVTGTQVRNGVTITGDEFRDSISITGESDQTVADDLIERGGPGYASSVQFQRQNNPHGASAAGTNLGRSIKHVGSRERGLDNPATETSLGGHLISGSAIGRSEIVTGDEGGSCRPVTGSQYMRAASDQPLCDMAGAPTPALRRMGMSPARGETETWARQRITGVEVEFKPGVTGDEPGTCSAITGTPYAGPAQYETYCEADMVEKATDRICPNAKSRPSITGNLPLNADGVTGTQRGSLNDVTGTPYYRAATPPSDAPQATVLAQMFSVKSPQREAQLASADTNPITGSFAVGSGKVTGNSEFDYVSRWQARSPQAPLPITGEGRTEGTAITGSAWAANSKVTGTEGFTAAGRNPTERTGKQQSFAGSSNFKSQAKTKIETHHVTGMAGSDPVGGADGVAARVTLSGGARG